MRKKRFLLMVAILLVTALFTPFGQAHAATTYVDIPTKHRAYKEITYLAQGDITKSPIFNRYEPDGYVTRAYAAAMIGSAIQLDGTQKDTSFADVPFLHFASGYIQEAVNRGLLKGYNDGTFAPDKTLTRGEMAVMISRAFGYQSDTTTAAAKEFLDKGISAGTGNGNFGTTDLMKRGDFAIFLARAMNAEFRVGDKALSATRMYVDVAQSDTLNMRKGPSTSYPIMKKLFAGYPVTSHYKVGDWVYIKVGSDYGFVHNNFLSSSQPSVSNIKDPIDVDVTTPTPPASGGSAKSIKNVTVIIDPGHGGSDPGASALGLREKDVVLDISLKAKRYFDQAKIPVKLTRETDRYLDLPDRVKFARDNKGSAFVSVHANAGGGTGIESYYYAASNTNVEQSKALSTYIQNRMLEAWNLRDRGVKKAPFYVIRWNTMPATLIEAGFIDNKVDNGYLASPTHRQSMGRAIYLGTLDYFYHYEGIADAANYYAQFNAQPSAKLH